jgi:hypothetical protein
MLGQIGCAANQADLPRFPRIELVEAERRRRKFFNDFSRARVHVRKRLWDAEAALGLPEFAGPAIGKSYSTPMGVIHSTGYRSDRWPLISAVLTCINFPSLRLYGSNVHEHPSDPATAGSSIEQAD